MIELKHVTNTGITLISKKQKAERPKGVILGMFKVDCLSIFGRNVLHMEASQIDDVLRSAYQVMLSRVTKLDLVDNYSNKIGHLLA